MTMRRKRLISESELMRVMQMCGDASRRAAQQGETPHLTPDEVVGYVERTLPLEKRADLLDHVVGCADCSEQVNAATRLRRWSVTLVSDRGQLMEVRTADRTWRRSEQADVSLPAPTDERVTASADAFLARRSQGDWDVILRACSGRDGRLSVSLCLVSREGHTPLAEVPVRWEQERGWDEVLVDDPLTNKDGCVTLDLPEGEFTVRIPAFSVLNVFLSVIPRHLVEDCEKE
jgi:hypothetical protein